MRNEVKLKYLGNQEGLVARLDAAVRLKFSKKRTKAEPAINEEVWIWRIYFELSWLAILHLNLFMHWQEAKIEPKKEALMMKTIIDKHPDINGKLVAPNIFLCQACDMNIKLQKPYATWNIERHMKNCRGAKVPKSESNEADEQ